MRSRAIGCTSKASCGTTGPSSPTKTSPASTAAATSSPPGCRSATALPDRRPSAKSAPGSAASATPRAWLFWPNCKPARREAEALFHFRPGHHDDGAGHRHFVQIGHDLDLIMAVLEDVGL